ncbi:MAG TPA: transketolase, partial [Candidatus Humimicrobiaceae bacterium]|nr:transketolase [Candidatus Humimicrobiaceae bacterium]
MTDKEKLDKLSKLIRYFILISTTKAGSGHPSSSLSAVELVSVLFFGGFFRFRINDIKYANNDRIIFSKGHASPLMYSLWAAAGALSEEELLTLRKFGSRLEGHPTSSFPYSEASTGSLGQGLSIGLGMALNAKYLDKLPYYTYVLLGDSEMTEGSQWEAIQVAAHYKLDNLIGILDVNRLGQRGETMYGWDIRAYKDRISSFGWETITINGHDTEEIADAYKFALTVKDRPTMIIAKTIKGKGVSQLEDMGGWHGKAIPQDQLDEALNELGSIDKSI